MPCMLALCSQHYILVINGPECSGVARKNNMVGHKSGHDVTLTETGNEICIMHPCGGLDQAHINFLPGILCPIINRLSMR